jgi:hypothetical protein
MSDSYPTIPPPPHEWPPKTDKSLTDDEAYAMCRLILDGKPKSYVEGAMRLATYVIELQEQFQKLEKVVDTWDDKKDTIPELLAASAIGGLTEE